MKEFKFSIIIANFNGERYLVDCLSSVFETDYPQYEVIIVEDGSIDRSLEKIQKFQSRYKFQLIQNDHNLGLVTSRNKAIKKASGDILVFLDNDTCVDKDWLKGIARTFSTDETIGAIQCKIFDFHKRDVIQEVGMKIFPYTGFGTPLGRGQKDHGQFDKPQEIIALGAAMAVRKRVATKLKGFDKRLFHYTDDLDFSWRVWILGYRIVLAPDAKVYHYTKVHKPMYSLYFHLSKNSIRMIVKNYEISNMIKFLMFSLILNIAGGLCVLFKTGKLSAILGVLSGIVWNVISLPDILKERLKIQSLRRAMDKDIFDKIMISSNVSNMYKLYFKTSRATISLMKGS